MGLSLLYAPSCRKGVTHDAACMVFLRLDNWPGLKCGTQSRWQVGVENFMEHAQMTPLARLLAAVESNDDLAVDELRRAMASNAHDKGQIHYAHEIGRVYYRKDVNAAISLCEAMLPGWGWNIAACCVSDDAWVFPDFNSPTHGDRLSKSVPQLIHGLEWAEYTDVDLRPAGNPARALLIAMLRALVAMEGGE